jgi:TolB-like protein/DNA-binding winged helix-turn-helix (wHTH) protein/Tfp pilus assembly protein PilF
MDAATPPERVYAFERFQLDPVGRTLTRDGVRIPLPARLFDTLLYLVENAGRLVAREELMAAVWPARTVEESSLSMAISNLRTALKQHGAMDNLIITAPGRGYRFGTAVAVIPLLPREDQAPAPGTVPLAPKTQSPPSTSTPTATPTATSRSKIAALSWPALLGLGLLLGGAALWTLRPRAGDHSVPAEAAFNPPPHSIAVLPFTDIGGEPNGAAFADGLTEEIINALGRGGTLRVAARLSSFAFKGTPATVATIARQLNVGLLLEGSIRREGDRLRVIAQLIDTTTGFQIWSRSYDREHGDILSLQGQLAEQVFSSLKIVLLPNEVARLTLGGTTNPQAFDAYLRGLPHAIDGSDTDERSAIADFTAAIARDPNYALAYAQRARALSYYAANGEFTDVAERKAAIVAALQDANHALALAPDLSDAHAALAFVLKCSLTELSRAGDEYTKAMELAPGDAAMLMGYALFETVRGHMQTAIEAAEHAAAMDPLTPITYRKLARILAFAGHYDDARAALRHAESLPTADRDADQELLVRISMWQGDITRVAQMCATGTGAYDYYCRAWLDEAQGRTAEGEADLAHMRTLIGDNGAFLYATIYARWGHPAQAVQWLQTAYRVSDPGLINLQIDPMLEPIRGTPEYKEIRAKLGFPP